MLTITGAVFLLLGMLSGVLLALEPFRVLEGTGWGNWLMFPGFTIFGYVCLLVGVRTIHVPKITRAAGAALLILALASTIALFLNTNAVFETRGSSAPLWFVLVFGVIFGTIGVSIRESQPE